LAGRPLPVGAPRTRCCSKLSGLAHLDNKAE
jgi:hypothetical protein